MNICHQLVENHSVEKLLIKITKIIIKQMVIELFGVLKLEAIRVNDFLSISLDS